ncbi:hypothetical protein RHSIM_Rhsim11G0131200 [Rhododendron simsii]|uniref:Prohibitin n=1 Tax=Rhododendron simsii TaxID=118357 RepID=A0A834LAM9_RHOSS|nr:hypothetical protein RHSIM_Rhsim11G0131200 [Rhododendron simsii]
MLASQLITQREAVGRELRKVAAQEADGAKFVVEKAEQEKQSAVIRAQGEVESAKLIGQSIANNLEFITSRKIEAAREVAQMLANPANKDLQLRIEATREIACKLTNLVEHLRAQ